MADSQESTPNDDWVEPSALRAIGQCWPHLASDTPEYAAILNGPKAAAQEFGAYKFELYYNLRPPVDRVEEWTRDCYQGRISKSEFRDRLKHDAERPVDLEMVTTFHEAIEGNLLHYCAILQKAVVAPSEDSPALRARRRREIDGHVAQLRGKLPLWRENLETVSDFLEEARLSANLGLATLGGVDAASAHWLAQLLFKRMAEGWRSCRDIARRSRRDRRYLYAASAIDLFRDQWLPTLPPPQNLSERLRQEFRVAKRALESAPSSAGPHEATQLDVEVAAAEVGASDNQSLEMLLLGDITTLVGRAGHIFRQTASFDVGLDGEIEFKDAEGQPSGKRVYVQLKSGDSYLTKRKSDGEEIFRVRTKRHLEYWSKQAYPVLLVIRQSSGFIRCMDISEYVRQHGCDNLQVVFRGQSLDVQAINALATAALVSPADPSSDLKGGT